MHVPLMKHLNWLDEQVAVREKQHLLLHKDTTDLVIKLLQITRIIQRNAPLQRLLG